MRARDEFQVIRHAITIAVRIGIGCGWAQPMGSLPSVRHAISIGVLNTGGNMPRGEDRQQSRSRHAVISGANASRKRAAD